MIATEVRQRPRGGLILTFPLGVDVLTSMLNRRLMRVLPGALDASIAAIAAGEQGLALLWGADYNSPLGSSSNGSVSAAIRRNVLTLTLARYLDTPAASVVQSLVSDRVTLGVGLGIAGDAVSEKVLIDGQVFTRITHEENAVLCEGRVRLGDTPGTGVQRRML